VAVHVTNSPYRAEEARDAKYPGTIITTSEGGEWQLENLLKEEKLNVNQLENRNQNLRDKI
jgi:hypothetical protein